jgi:hypothetical protein
MMREEACEIGFDASVSRQAWEFALPLAATFWSDVMADRRVSSGFREIAAEMKARLSPIAAIIQKMA